MFHTKIKTASILILTLAVSNLAYGFGKNTESPSSQFTVEIQNLTLNQPLTPPVITTGSKKIFEVGTKSSEALRKLAEDGDTSGFSALKRTAVIGENVIMPGQTATFSINKGSNYQESFISIVSMLARTNDAFIGVSGKRIYSPLRNKPILLNVGQTKVIYARVYDAGTEANTESCAHIPAPPCNSPKVRVTEGAEGIILPHRGLDLNGDLISKDKFAPIAAKIKITRNF